MYRMYENPCQLEDMVKEAEARYAQAVASGVDVDRLVSLAEDVAELKERANFAWQDEEFEEDSAKYGY